MNGEQLGKKIDQLRHHHGYSLQQVADRCEASKSHIWELERGRSKNPTLDMLVKLAACFDMSLPSLLGTDNRDEMLIFGVKLSGLLPSDKKLILDIAKRLNRAAPKANQSGGQDA